MKQAKRILSMLLSLCLVLGFIPCTVFATASNPFTDIDTTEWYADAVQYVYDNGIMVGTSDTTFSPKDITTRGMVVTLLHNLDGNPAADGTTFADVPEGQWYTDAVSWASANGIVSGYGNGMFGPSDTITREQMVTILNHYSEYKGYVANPAASIDSYADAAQVSSFAVESLGWAIANDLISGTGNNMLTPMGSATRAEIATILLHFCDNIVANSTKTYSVTFDLNYGSDTLYGLKTVEKGKTVSKPSDPSRTGYTFDGWYTEKTGGIKFDFETAITSNLILYARWTINTGSSDEGASSTPSITYYSVTFDLNYIDAVQPTTYTVQKGSTVAKPSNPYRIGYTFTGWYTEEARGSVFDFDTPISGDITLYAHWTLNFSGDSEPSVPYYYQVTFDPVATDATNVPATQQVLAGETAEKPSAPEREGYDFDGWYTDSALTNLFDFTAPILSNITLYAKWTRISSEPTQPGPENTSVNVTFALNDGTTGVYEIQVLKPGETATRPAADPVREFYRFTGWYTESGTAAEYDFSTPVTADITLYAGWGAPDGSDNMIYSAGSGGGTEPAITGVETYNGSVTVTVSTDQLSVLVVEFLDEDAFWAAPEGTEKDLPALGAVATETPEYCELEPVSIPMTSTASYLPEHYVICVRLLGSDGTDLCAPYFSIKNSTKYEEFKSKTFEDRVQEYGENRVIVFGEDKESYGVFAEDVKGINQNGLNNILKVNWIGDEYELFPTACTYTFSNPDSTVTSLTVGDKIYAISRDTSPVLFKIKEIVPEINGAITFIPDDDVSLEDFYTVINADLKPEEAAPVSLDYGIMPVLEIIDVDTTLTHSINRTINWTPKPGWSVSGSINLGVSLSIEIAYDAHLFSKDYIECSVIGSIDTGIELSISKTKDNNDKVEKAWEITRVTIPTNVPGLNVFLQPSIPVEMSLKGSAVAKFTATLKAGFEYNTPSGLNPVGSANYTKEFSLTGEAELKAGPKVALGIALVNDTAKAEINAQAGIKITATAFVGSVETNEDSKHGCILCLDGDAKWFKNAKAELSYKIGKFQDKFTKTIYEVETTVSFGGFQPGKFYLSIIHGEDSVFKDHNGEQEVEPVFGPDSCPNITWRTTFVVQDESGNPIEGVDLDIVRKNGTMHKTGTTQLVEYLHDGVYTVTGTINGTSISKSFTVNGAAQEIVLSPNSADSKLSGYITDAQTGNTIEGATIVAKLDSMIIASTTSNADGSYALQIPEGDYLLVVSKEGYITSRVGISIPNHRDISQSIDLTPGENGLGGFSGQIVDSSTAIGIPGVRIEVRKGANAPASSEILKLLETDANGRFQYAPPKMFSMIFGLPAGSYTITASKSGYITRSFNITVVAGVQNNVHQEESLTRLGQAEAGTYKIVLSWGKDPRDLDSHVQGKLTNGNSYHVYFSHKSQYDGNTEVCNLDVDDTTSYGPETIVLKTVTDQPYYYYIYKYAGNSDIAHSRAVIELFDENGLIDVFYAPTDQGSGRYWNVFAIVDGRIVVKNTVTSSVDLSYASSTSTANISLFENIMPLDLEEEKEATALPSVEPVVTADRGNVSAQVAVISESGLYGDVAVSVYDLNSEVEASGVTAFFNNGIITLVFDEAITSSKEYDISVVEDGKTESGKLPITVYPNPEA